MFGRKSKENSTLLVRKATGNTPPQGQTEETRPDFITRTRKYFEEMNDARRNRLFMLSTIGLGLGLLLVSCAGILAILNPRTQDTSGVFAGQSVPLPTATPGSYPASAATFDVRFTNRFTHGDYTWHIVQRKVTGSEPAWKQTSNGMECSYSPTSYSGKFWINGIFQQVTGKRRSTCKNRASGDITVAEETLNFTSLNFVSSTEVSGNGSLTSREIEGREPGTVTTSTFVSDTGILVVPASPLVAAAKLARCAPPAGKGITVGPNAGQLAPDFSVIDLHGRSTALHQLGCRPLILTFWFTSSAPAVEDSGLLNNALDRYTKKHLLVVGVDFEEAIPAVKTYQTSHKINYLFLIDSTGQTTLTTYRLNALPVTFFIDAQGVIRQKIIGGLDPAKLDAQIQTILSSRK